MKEIPEPAHCEICEEEIRHLQKQVATTEGTERARTLLELGMAALVGYRLDLALASFGACLDLIDQEVFPDIACEALFKESCVLAEMERYDEAIESLSKAREISYEEGDLEHVALYFWTEGNYLTSYNRKDEAYECITAARDLYLDLDQLAMAALCERDLKDLTAPPKRVRKTKTSGPKSTRRSPPRT